MPCVWGANHKPMPHLALIDGPNYVFRAFHAVRHLANSKGEPTNAIYGYVQMLRTILDRLQPSHVAVVFDPRGTTFRHDIYPDYKAHRPPMPEELAQQWESIYAVTDAFNLKRICINNFEADDVIATLADQAAAINWDVTIISTDKDLMQLVNKNITMLDTMKNRRFDTAAVIERWGVPPDRLHDLLALAGDSADNIPGVPGIGPKTAAHLIQTYGDLEAVLAHAHEIKQNKRRETLIEHAEQARLSYRLVALENNMKTGVTLDALNLQAPDHAKLAALFNQFEFKRLYQEFATTQSEETPEIMDHKRLDHLVDNEYKLTELVKQLKNAPLIALDTETTSLCCHDAALVGISFSLCQGEGWYVPVGHQASDLLTPSPKQLSLAVVLTALRPILEDPDLSKCGHNLKYDQQVLLRAGIVLAGITFDSMLLAYCLYPGKYPPKMDRVAEDYLNYQCITYQDVAGKGVKQIGFAQVSIEDALPYACEDAEVTLRLCQLLTKKLAEEERLTRHDDIERPLASVLAAMEWSGAKVDRAILNQLSQRFGTQIDKLESKIIEFAGCKLNIHSPKQVGVLLFETLALPGGKKTKSGQWATGQEILESLAELHPIAAKLLELRKLAKLKSTYTDALLRLVHPQTERVHTSYNQAITTTGRLSSSDPNLQNIPIRTEEGRKIRSAFIAAEGSVLISADYSQIELRLMAHFSGDSTLCQAFADGLDIHTATAAAIHQVEQSAVDGEMRRHAKVINFGILYGMSAFGLSKQLGIERADAKAFIDAYFDRYPKVRTFTEQTLEMARAKGYVDTLLGHRVYVADINASNGMRRQYAERTAVNAPLQGSAADIIKVAMIRLHQVLQLKVPQAKLILQVHDELVVEAAENDAKTVAALMQEVMEDAVKLQVPLTVDIGMGKNWYDAHSL
ncbi:MAG: DNA polymerase I [Mariprofundaceae bacterium]